MIFSVLNITSTELKMVYYDVENIAYLRAYEEYTKYDH